VLPEILSIDWSVAKTKNNGLIFRDVALHFVRDGQQWEKLSALSDQPVNYTPVLALVHTVTGISQRLRR
jgi:hypothetical protein